ncbi:prepilin-type N-terminal cleavage/methylation domain-containing protein [Sulfurimonas sp.]
MVARYAFTMIELIFAIVIIGISVISLPMISQVTSQSVEGNLVQEAIFAASTELNQVVSYHWDENSTEGSNILSRVVWTSTTDCDNDTKLRPGHINQPYHRRCTDDNSTRPSDIVDGADDLDDMEHTVSDIFIGNATTNKGYKTDYQSTISVDQNASFGGANDTNIKRVRVVISNTGVNIVQLDTFSCNIGEIDYLKRTF